MDFSKVKMFVCLCLLVVNIIIAILCINLVREKQYIPEQEAELAAQHLSGIGIDVEFDRTARMIHNLPIYTVQNSETSNIPKIYKKITETFFDVSLDDDAYVKTPDGYSVSVKNTKGILLGTASLIGKNQFECYVESAVNIRDISEISKLPSLQKLVETKKSEDFKVASKFANTVFQDYGIRLYSVGERDYADGKIVCFCAELSGTKVLNLYINVYVKKGRILCCVGNLTDSIPEKKYSAELVDSVDLMYLITDYLEDKTNNSKSADIKIIELSMNYKMFELKQNEYYIIPVWMVGYEDRPGNVNYAIIDAVTGSNMEEPE